MWALVALAAGSSATPDVVTIRPGQTATLDPLPFGRSHRERDGRPPRSPGTRQERRRKRARRGGR